MTNPTAAPVLEYGSGGVDESGSDRPWHAEVTRYQWLVLASLVSLLGALWVGAGAGERRTR